MFYTWKFGKIFYICCCLSQSQSTPLSLSHAFNFSPQDHNPAHLHSSPTHHWLYLLQQSLGTLTLGINVLDANVERKDGTNWRPLALLWCRSVIRSVMGWVVVKSECRCLSFCGGVGLRWWVFVGWVIGVEFWWAGLGVFKFGFEVGGRNCYSYGGSWVLMVAE